LQPVALEEKKYNTYGNVADDASDGRTSIKKVFLKSRQRFLLEAGSTIWLGYQFSAAKYRVMRLARGGACIRRQTRVSVSGKGNDLSRRNNATITDKAQLCFK